MLRSSASCAATSPARAGRTTSAPARCAASRCPRACASPSSCPSRSSRLPPRPSRRPRRERRLRRVARDRGRRAPLEERGGFARALRVGAAHARERGIILADTEFEFGRPRRRIVLGDEVLTPDSSRFWPADAYEPGRGQPSFDKQFVRDWASNAGWDKSPPGARVPDEVVEGTRAALRRGLRAHHRRAVPPPGSSARGAKVDPLRFGVDPAPPRHPRPAGPRCGEGAPGSSGAKAWTNVRVGPG